MTLETVVEATASIGADMYVSMRVLKFTGSVHKYAGKYAFSVCSSDGNELVGTKFIYTEAETALVDATTEFLRLRKQCGVLKREAFTQMPFINKTYQGTVDGQLYVILSVRAKLVTVLKVSEGSPVGFVVDKPSMWVPS